MILSRVLDRLARLLPAPLLALLLLVLWSKLAQPSPASINMGASVVALTGGLALAAALWPFLQLNGATRTGAHALDRHFQLEGRLLSALEFSHLPAPQQGGFIAAAIDDALRNLARTHPGQAVPLRFSPAWLANACLLTATLLLLLVQPPPLPSVTESPPPEPKQVELLNPDDVALLQSWTRELDRKVAGQSNRATVEEFNQLVEELAAGRLTKEEVFRKLATLDERLGSTDTQADQELQSGLTALAKELKRSALGAPLAKALAAGDLQGAQDAASELARKLERKPNGLSKRELAKLRTALEAASKSSQQRVARLKAQRATLEKKRKRLLKRKGKSTGQASQKTAKTPVDRQLKRLQRQLQQTQRAQKALSALDRELAKAAAELMKEMGAAGQALKQGAQQLQELEMKRLSRKEKRELKKQLEALRDLLRKEAKGGASKRKKQLEALQRRARGKAKGKGKGKGKQPTPGKLKLGTAGNRALALPGGAMQAQGGKKQGAPTGESGGGESGGEDHNKQVRGSATKPPGSTKDVAAAGVDSGQGDVSSKVVASAADQGFADIRYGQVHAEYESVAEELIATDTIPPGHKSYIRRYFQLIRPRQ